MAPPPGVNYDQVAPTYHRRYDFSPMASVATALVALAQDRGATRVLEIGCGTGRWLVDMQAAAPRLYGLDLSGGMLQQARRRNRSFCLARGQASQPPFPDRFFDLVFCVNALHHFDRPRHFVTEASRLLRPGGTLAVVGMDPRQHRERWYIYDYFDGTFEADLSRFPSWKAVAGWLAADGFVHIERGAVARVLDHKLGRKVLVDPFLKKEAASQLTLLTDDAYAAGLRRIETAVEKAERAGTELLFPVDLSMIMLTGRRP